MFPLYALLALAGAFVISQGWRSYHGWVHTRATVALKEPKPRMIKEPKTRHEMVQIDEMLRRIHEEDTNRYNSKQPNYHIPYPDASDFDWDRKNSQHPEFSWQEYYSNRHKADLEALVKEAKGKRGRPKKSTAPQQSLLHKMPLK